MWLLLIKTWKKNGIYIYIYMYIYIYTVYACVCVCVCVFEFVSVSVYFTKEICRETSEKVDTDIGVSTLTCFSMEINSWDLKLNSINFHRDVDS